MENIVNFNQEPVNNEINSDLQNQRDSMAQLQTHLQVSNLVQILYTVDIKVLKTLVEKAPDELKNSPHFFVLSQVLNLYKSLGGDKE